MLRAEIEKREAEIGLLAAELKRKKAALRKLKAAAELDK
jgi:hypothetical protein